MQTVERRQVEVRVPAATFAKVALFAILVWAFLRLWPSFLLFVVAVLLAVTLQPIAAFFERRGLSRGPAVLVVTLTVVVVLAGAFALLGPPMTKQLAAVVGDYDGFRQRVLTRLPPKWPALDRGVEWAFRVPEMPEVRQYFSKPLSWGVAATEGVGAALFVLVVMLYLLYDGKRLYAWLLAYVPRRHRAKMARTVDEVSDVVLAYVAGQALTSALVAVYSGIVLTALRVPAALPLAVLAGICDVLPFIGVIAFTVPAVLLAFTVSPSTALVVLALYAAYHLLENYVIVPKVYGERLRLSTLTVLLALVVGAELQGILGAVLVLPIVAAYPIIEKIWLTEALSDEVLEDHEILSDVEGGEGEEKVDQVLKGEVESAAQPPEDHAPH